MTLTPEQVNVNLRTALWVKTQNEFNIKKEDKTNKFLVRSLRGNTWIMPPYRKFKPLKPSKENVSEYQVTMQSIVHKVMQARPFLLVDKSPEGLEIINQ